MAAPGKQYGLILSQKKSLTKNATLQRPSVFGDDSDDEVGTYFGCFYFTWKSLFTSNVNWPNAVILVFRFSMTSLIMLTSR
uniref:Uncharacterized protein n=1 Tax=Gadus morhua TaxID=8049 RepID=A0A8C4ZW12_GADMO